MSHTTYERAKAVVAVKGTIPMPLAIKFHPYHLANIPPDPDPITSAKIAEPSLAQRPDDDSLRARLYSPANPSDDLAVSRSPHLQRNRLAGVECGCRIAVGIASHSIG